MKLVVLKEKFFLFWFKTENKEWISFFRIIFGLFCLLHFLSVLSDFELLYTTKGVLPTDIMNVFTADYLITLPKIISFFENFGVNETSTVAVFKLVYISLCLLLIIGFFPRTAAFLLLFCQIALVRGSSFYMYGVDFFTSMSLFYLILIPSDYHYSIFPKTKEEKQINTTPYLRLFQLHLSIAYFFSGFDKVLGFNWRNGESIWKAINLPYANLDFGFDFTFLVENPFLLITIGWATILIEMCYPLFIWVPKTRNIWLFLTISMHLGIALILNLYFFSTLMIIWNLVAFYNFNKK